MERVHRQARNRVAHPAGEYALDIRVEKRIGPNRDVTIDATGLADRIMRLRRKSHEPIDGLELEGIPFMQSAIGSDN